MINLKKQIPTVLFLLLFLSCLKDEKKSNIISQTDVREDNLEVLLLGTFHFANYNPANNLDLVQKNVSDVLTPQNQVELEIIAQKIKSFNPDKIFVEYSFYKQKRLDSLFRVFPKNSDYSKQKRGEIIQIGFRVAKELNHERLYAIDVKTSFPYDSLLATMKKAKQFDLIKRDKKELKELESTAKDLFNSGKKLSEILFFYNETDYRKNDINWYVSLANQGGELNNFVGSYLASEWYKRNLQMYALIQKQIAKDDKRIMILAGSSHIAMIKEFISFNPKWSTVELQQLMEK